MSEIIIISPEQLKTIVNEAIKEILPKSENSKTEIDTISLTDALHLLCSHGFPTSKAKIYKLTSSGELPHRKYGNKLVFSRKELLRWAESQTKEKSNGEEVLLNLARSAKRKR